MNVKLEDIAIDQSVLDICLFFPLHSLNVKIIKNLLIYTSVDQFQTHLTVVIGKYLTANYFRALDDTNKLYVLI